MMMSLGLDTKQHTPGMRNRPSLLHMSRLNTGKSALYEQSFSWMNRKHPYDCWRPQFFITQAIGKGIFIFEDHASADKVAHALVQYIHRMILRIYVHTYISQIAG